MKKIISIFVVVCVLLAFVGCSNNSYSEESQEYYLKETMNYEDIYVTINNLSEKKIDDSENYILTINFTLNNNRNKTFKFSYSDIYIKTEKKGEKYTYSATSLDQVLFSNSVIAGGTETYDIKFKVPYSFYETKFNMYIDWGILSFEQEYHLYPRNGSFSEGGPFVSENEQDDEFKQTLMNMRDDIFNIYKQYVYDQISSKMSYTEVQKLMDSAEAQIKTQINTLSTFLDLSNGTFFPKWIINIRTKDSQTHSLIYIEVELSTTYKCTHKYIGKYEIN